MPPKPKKKSWTKAPPVIRVPFKPSYPPSEEQKPIFQEAMLGDENIHIDAGPGCGKSTTMLWAMTKEPHRSACCLSMGKAIVTEIEPHCPQHVEVGTAHKFGRAALVTALRKQPYLFQNKVKQIFKDTWPSLDPDKKQGKEKGAAYSFMYDFLNLVDKMRLNLADENNPDDILRIVMQYNISIQDMSMLATMIPIVFQKILENPATIDFTDMMWLPIRMDLPVPKFDMIYVDERQDLNSLMIEYVNRMFNGRIMTVGDKFQSIYGFGGADIHSTERLIGRFPGMELPLKTCYRCGKKIVEKVNAIYPGLKAFDGNIDGEVIEADDIDYEMPDGSMILARRNAVLVKPCFALLRKGRKAIIKGKQIGEGLIRLIESMKAVSPVDLIDKIEAYRDARLEKLLSKEDVKQAQVDATNDETQCVIEIAMCCQTVEEVIDRINYIFDENTQGIMLSSIHRSKGLESDEVTIIDYARVRISNERMTEEEHIQEKNLEYVALSRAKKKLTLIL